MRNKLESILTELMLGKSMHLVIDEIMALHRATVRRNEFIFVVVFFVQLVVIIILTLMK